MLYLKEANMTDAEKEFEFITKLPENENGFTNVNYGISKEDFVKTALPQMMDSSKGINLPEGYVPETNYFLWNHNDIVGVFRIRHYLNEKLKHGAGHIGYGIAKEYRGRGFATEGLALTIELAKKMIREDEIYMSVHKENRASLRVQEKNGAYVHHSDEVEFYTRIRL